MVIEKICDVNDLYYIGLERTDGCDSKSELLIERYGIEYGILSLATRPFIALYGIVDKDFKKSGLGVRVSLVKHRYDDPVNKTYYRFGNNPEIDAKNIQKIVDDYKNLVKKWDDDKQKLEESYLMTMKKVKKQ
jgi:hypothetical protein